MPNPYQPDPNAFQWGNAFISGGIQREEQQRRNALLDMEQQQNDLLMRRQGMAEDEYVRGIQSERAAAEQAQAGIQRRAKILGELLPDQFKPMAGELAAELDDGDIAKMMQERMAPNGNEPYTLGPGSKRFGPDGKVIAEVPFAPANQTVIKLPSGQVAFNPRTGAQTPLSTQQEEIDAAVNKAVAETLGKAGAEAEAAQTAKATGATSTLRMFDGVEDLIDKAPAGYLGQARVGTTRALGAESDAANAQSKLESLSLNAVLDRIKSFGANPTEGEREALLKSLGDLSNPLKTRGERKAAVEQTRSILRDIEARGGGNKQPTRPGQGASGADNDPLGIRN